MEEGAGLRGSAPRLPVGKEGSNRGRRRPLKPCSECGDTDLQAWAGGPREEKEAERSFYPVSGYGGGPGPGDKTSGLPKKETPRRPQPGLSPALLAGRDPPTKPGPCPAPAPNSSSQGHPSIGRLGRVAGGPGEGGPADPAPPARPCPRPWLYSCCSFISMSDTRMFFSVASPGPDELRL